MKEIFKKIVASILRMQARGVVRMYRPRIVAVTGSVGKTATKDAIFAVVAHGAFARKSEKSFNSEIGLPLTILGVPNAWANPLRWVMNFVDGFVLLVGRSRYPQWLVLEVGADRPGDISSVAQWLPVDVAVITRLPETPVHVEFFDSAQAVVEEKASLIEALNPGGTLILFGDDEHSRALASRTQEKVLTFGFSDGCDIRAQDVKMVFEEGGQSWPVGMEARLQVGGTTIPVSIVGAVGAHALLPLLAAAAVGQALGQDPMEIAEALKSYTPPQGRMRLVRGLKNTLIIDDTYNSSPAAATAALDALSQISPSASPGVRSRRIAILGDMLELGRLSSAEHRKVGAHAAQTADMLVTVGFRARGMAEGAQDSGMAEQQILQYEDSTRAGEELKNIIQEGDCLLIKGSQTVRMERVVEELMLEPERAEELLVRQDPEWKKR